MSGTVFLASDLTAALEGLWRAIQTAHPDVPRAVITVASGGSADGRTMKWGHYAHSAWVIGAGKEGRVSEVMLAGERLAHGPLGVLETMLHEAVHGIATTRKIKDTSRDGRYHNERFCELADEVGLSCVQDKTYGWLTHGPRPGDCVSRVACRRYTDATAAISTALGGGVVHRRNVVAEIRALVLKQALAAQAAALGAPAGATGPLGVQAALSGAEPGETAETPPERTGGRRDGLVCACSRRIQVARGVAAQGPILCGVCGQPFTHGVAA